MTTLIEPNIHPILVHFAYALSVTATIAYLITFLAPGGRWIATLRPAADWMLAFAAIAIMATVAAGFQAYYSVAHDTPSHEAMTTHRNWAVPSAIAILTLAAWRWRMRAKPQGGFFTLLIAVAALSLSVAAWWGGHIVYNYGLGVKSLPVVTGDGHDHDHGASEPHGDQDTAVEVGHDNSDGHHNDDASAEPHDASDVRHDDLSSVGQGTEGTPEYVVDQFQLALKAGDSAALEALMTPDAIIAEGGASERSFDEYASHHMLADMTFTAAADSMLKKRDVIANEDMATVISESQIHGMYKGKNIHSRMMETMVLRLKDDDWRIAHIHWSSASVTGDHEH